MAKIRVTPSHLLNEADKLQRISEEVEDVGEQVKAAADCAPSYDDQFGPTVIALGSDAMTRSQKLAQNLSALAEELRSKGEEFEAADLAGVLGLDAILAKFEAWLSSDNLLALDEFPIEYVTRLLILGTLLSTGGGGSPDEEPDWEPPWWAPVAISAANIWFGYDQNVNQYLYAMFGQGNRGDDDDSPLPVPILPPSDEGSGPHDVEKPSAADRAFESIIYIVAEKWEAERPDTARHMRHYLENSGDTLEVNIEKMIRDMPEFEQYSHDYFDEFLHRDIMDHILQTYKEKSLQFDITSKWNNNFYATQDRSENWYYAMGGFHYAYSASVNVEPPISPDGNPIVEVQYQMFVHDVYNWDQGKWVTIEKPTLPLIDEYSIPIPEEYQKHILDQGDQLLIYDTALMQLHRAGLAHEYLITGQSEIHSLSFEIDLENGQISNIEQIPIADESGR